MRVCRDRDRDRKTLDGAMKFCCIRYIQLEQIAEYANYVGAIEATISRNNITRLPPLSRPKYISMCVCYRLTWLRTPKRSTYIHQPTEGVIW